MKIDLKFGLWFAAIYMIGVCGAVALGAGMKHYVYNKHLLRPASFNAQIGWNLQLQAGSAVYIPVGTRNSDGGGLAHGWYAGPLKLKLGDPTFVGPGGLVVISDWHRSPRFTD